MSCERYVSPAERAAELLGRAGLVVTATLGQEPEGRLPRRHACPQALNPRGPRSGWVTPW